MYEESAYLKVWAFSSATTLLQLGCGMFCLERLICAPELHSVYNVIKERVHSALILPPLASEWPSS